MIGAVEVAGFRLAVRLDDAIIGLQDIRKTVFKLRCAIANNDHVMRPANGQGAIHIDASNDLVEGHGWVFCEVFRPKQSGFFERDRYEQQ